MACSSQAACLIPEMLNQASATVPEIIKTAIWQHPSSYDAAVMSLVQQERALFESHKEDN